MNTTTLIVFLVTTLYFSVMGFCAGVMFEDKNLRKWFTKELDVIEKRYKRKYGKEDKNEENN